MLSKNQCWRCDKETNQGKKCRTCHEAYYCSDECSNTDVFRHSSDCHDVALRYVCRGHGCRRKSNEKMMMCSNCMGAWFCGQECLKKTWAAHKTECKEISTKVRILAPALLKHVKSIGTFSGTFSLYYFGNSPALDLLNLSLNEGCEYSEDLSLLLCGVGDPRNVCLTISKLQTTNRGKVNFVLNDICACTLARTVLLLYLLCKVGQDAAASVTQIWYSLYLSHDDHALVVSCLEDLVRISNLEVITRGIMKIDTDHLHKLKDVWKTWLILSKQEIDLSQQRRQNFNADAQAEEGMKKFLEEIPQRHQCSMREWLKYGVLLKERKRKKATKDNFTLTGSVFQFYNNSGPFVYNIGSSCMPFSGWDYKDAIAAYLEVSDVNELYNRYVTDVLNQCAAHLQTERIQISFILCNCQDIATATYIPDGLTFDRITVSNLWDFIPLSRLFVLLKPFLNQSNKSAVLVTESHNWSAYFPLFDGPTCAMMNSPEIKHKIFQDTGNRKIAESKGLTAFEDYYSFTEKFTCFARASILHDSKPLTSLIPSLDQLAAEFGLKPRDFICHGNRICPFRWKLNCRRVNMMRGTVVTIEWTLL